MTGCPPRAKRSRDAGVHVSHRHRRAGFTGEDGFRSASASETGSRMRAHHGRGVASSMMERRGCARCASAMCAARVGMSRNEGLHVARRCVHFTSRVPPSTGMRRFVDRVGSSMRPRRDGVRRHRGACTLPSSTHSTMVANGDPRKNFFAVVRLAFGLMKTRGDVPHVLDRPVQVGLEKALRFPMK